jgi:hypothetical protein
MPPITRIRTRIVRKDGRIARLEVKRPRIRVACEDRGARRAGMEIQPLFRLIVSISDPTSPRPESLTTYRRMPMQLPHPLGFNNHIRARDRLCDGEIRRVDLPPLPAASWRRFRRM